MKELIESSRRLRLRVGLTLLLGIAAAIFCALPGTARANPLDPTNFVSLGALALTNGTYNLNSSGPNPVLLDSASNTLYTGVIYNQGGNYDGNVAVFDFSSIFIGAAVTITNSGANVVAFLSRASIDIAGVFNGNGMNGGNQGAGTGGGGGPGGGYGGTGSGGSGQGPGGGGGGGNGLGNGSWGDGGSFGGEGAGGADWNPFVAPSPTYGDLTAYLEGGSGGGASGQNLFGTGAGGGGGGGGFELGAAVAITLEGTAQVLANGGNGGGGDAVNAGGGSGGGILLHAPTISFNDVPLVEAQGDGGGRITFLTQSGTVSGNTAGVDVGGSTFGNPGVITFDVLSGDAVKVAIGGQPQSVAIFTGITVQLIASNITGSIPITLQWQLDSHNLTDGGNVSGSQTATLTISNATTANSGTYQLLATNSAGATLSSNVTVMVVAPVPGSYEAAALAYNPIIFWKLNETNDPSVGGVLAFDYMGGHNGTYQTAAQNGFNGIQGPQPPPLPGFPANNAALGTISNLPNSFVSASSGGLMATNFTYVLWIKPSTSVQPGAGLLFDRGGFAEGLDFGATTNAAGMPELGYDWNENGGSAFDFDSYVFPPTNVWSLVALAIQPTQAAIYAINSIGVQAATNAIPHDSEPIGVAWHIGDDAPRDIPLGELTFPGSISDVSVFLSALSLSQLTSLYNAGAGIGEPVTLYITPSGNGNVTLTWAQGALLQSTNVNGPWTTNTATSPYLISATNSTMFFQVRVK